VFGRNDIPGRGGGQDDGRRVVERDGDHLAATGANAPSQPAPARRSQCDRRRGEILPPASPRREHPTHRQIGHFRVFGQLQLGTPTRATQQSDDRAVDRGQVVGRRVLQLRRGQVPIGAPSTGFEDPDDTQIEREGEPAWGGKSKR